MTDVTQLREALKPQLHAVPTGRTDVPSITTKEARKGLLLSSRGKELLTASRVNGDDRSARLYELASLLRDAETSPDEAFVLIRGSVWNKFRGRDDEVERLWEAIERSREASDTDLQGRQVRRGRQSTSISTLLGRNIQPSEWAVDRVWGHKQYGFVAGEPKTYKSTFTTDLAVSIATGTDFLGHFPVPKPGPVLIVQEENTEQIQYGRFKRVLRERNLSGKLHSWNSGVLEFTPPTNCPVYSLDRQRFTFTSKQKRATIEREIAELKPALVIFDPLQMMMGDLSLRSESDVAKVLSWLNYLNKSADTGILIVHHYHKRREEGPQLGGQRMLGSQALHAWLMCGLYIQRVHGSRLQVNREFRAFTDYTPFELEFESQDGEDIYNVEVHENAMKTDLQIELLDVIRQNPWQTASAYAKTIGKSRRAVGEMLDRMGCQKKKKKRDNGGRPTVVFGPPAKSA
jgi:hypothetical protein